jgi:hypothetical protein
LLRCWCRGTPTIWKNVFRISLIGEKRTNPMSHPFISPKPWKGANGGLVWPFPVNKRDAKTWWTHECVSNIPSPLISWYAGFRLRTITCDTTKHDRTKSPKHIYMMKHVRFRSWLCHSGPSNKH